MRRGRISASKFSPESYYVRVLVFVSLRANGDDVPSRLLSTFQSHSMPPFPHLHLRDTYISALPDEWQRYPPLITWSFPVVLLKMLSSQPARRWIVSGKLH